jgi:hypothetical protein
MTRPSQGNPWFISAFVLVIFLLAWHVFTLRPTFDPRGLTEEQLQLMEFNGDIVRVPDGSYAWSAASPDRWPWSRRRGKNCQRLS